MSMKSFKHFIGFLFCVFTGLFYSCNFFNTSACASPSLVLHSKILSINFSIIESVSY